MLFQNNTEFTMYEFALHNFYFKRKTKILFTNVDNVKNKRSVRTLFRLYYYEKIAVQDLAFRM